MEVKKGDTIKWRNLDTVAHTVTSKNGEFDSGPLISNTQSNSCFPYCSPTFTYKFSEYGVYNYHCTIHSWMQGTVIVAEFGAGAEVSVSGEGGSAFIEKRIYEVVGDQEATVKVYGTVLQPSAGNKIFLTVTYPDGMREGLTTFVTTKGYFETFINIGSENRGTINLSVTHTEHFDIGTLSFEVVKKTPIFPEEPEVPTFPPNDNTTLVVVTDSKSYKSGSQIRISGVVPYLGEFNPYYGSDLTIQMINPQNSIVTISQVTPSDNGRYSLLINSEGPTWKTEGEYTVKVLYGTETASTTFAFTNPNSVPTLPTTPSKIPTVLTLDPIPTRPTVGEIVTFSGTLMTTDGTPLIDEKISIRNGMSELSSTQLTTGMDGSYGGTMKMNQVGVKYEVFAFFYGSSVFVNSYSETRNFTVVQPPNVVPPPLAPTEPDPSGGIALLVIIMIVVIVAIAIKRRKKMIPPIQTSGSRVSPKPEKVFPKVEKVLPKPESDPIPAKVLPKVEKVSHKAEKPISKSPDRFECKCGHHTCKKFYRTERQLRFHQGGVKAAKKKAEAEKMYRNISLSPSEMKQYIQDVKKHTEKEKARLAKEAKEKEAEKMYRNIDKLHGKEPEVSPTNSVSRVKNKRSYEPGDFATDAEKQWIKDHDFKTESELEQYIKDTKDTQKYDDDGNLQSEAEEPPRREIKQDVNKLLEKEPEIIQTISREMVTEFLNDKYTINKSLKNQYIDEYRIHKSVAKVIELHSATGSTRKEGEIKRHLITGLRLPAELRKLEEEGGLHANYGCSKKIALFATDYFSWDGQKNKEKDVVNLAVAISEYLQSDLELNQKFKEGKRSDEFLIDQQKRDKIHEKYRFEEYSSSWQRVDRTVPQYNKLYRNKNLEVVEFLCRWEFKHKNRLPFRIADALLDNPEEALEKYKDELL